MSDINTDAGKLRILADWFDKRDNANDFRGEREVQAHLRRIADEIERLRDTALDRVVEFGELQTALEEVDSLKAENRDLHHIAITVEAENAELRAKCNKFEMWWKASQDALQEIMEDICKEAEHEFDEFAEKPEALKYEPKAGADEVNREDTETKDDRYS